MKELIIFVLYLNVGNISDSQIHEKLAIAKNSICITFTEIEYQTNYLIRYFIFPVKNENTKMECIFPKDKDVDLSFLENALKDKGIIFNE